MRTLACTTSLLVLCLCLAGCEFGQVDQGRCVAYDAGQKTFTLVLDVNHDVTNPSYTGGVRAYLMPSDSSEIGPEPAAGGLVQLFPEKNEVVIYSGGELRTVPVEFVEVREGVKAANELVKGKSFPVVDAAASTVTEYYPRLERLVTFRIPDDCVDLPVNTWDAGDECRVYYKDDAKHQALRFMNVTQTNIFKR